MTGTVKYGNVYNELLEFIIPVDVTFYTLMVGRGDRVAAQGAATCTGLTGRSATRCPSLIYIGLAVFLVLDFIYLKPWTSGKGFLIVLAGIPVYLVWSRVAASPSLEAIARTTTTPSLETMIVSWNWLTDYLRLDMPVEASTERLALSGLNLESIADVGGDIAIDLEVTSNRPDCLGHLGVAARSRSFSTSRCACPTRARRRRARRSRRRRRSPSRTPTLCPRFTARVVTGVKVGESPWWLRKRLETIGVRPISNIVDVTNYVMFECGQPLHAYDLDRLAEHRLVVRRARAGETLTAINNRVYELNPDMLVIADAEPTGRPGGRDGRAGDRDRPRHDQRPDRGGPVRRDVGATDLARAGTLQPIELPVRAAARSRGDRMGQPPLRRADPEGGRRHAPSRRDRRRPRGRPSGRRSRSGSTRSSASSASRSTARRPREILRRPGARAARRGSGRSLTLPPPTWRSDLEREIDLIEEVARIHGYEHIPEDRAVPLTSAPRGTARAGRVGGRAISDRRRLRRSRDVQPGRGPPGSAGRHRSGLPAPARRPLQPQARDAPCGRAWCPACWPCDCTTKSHGQFDAELFEIANVYLPRPGQRLPDEPTRLALVSGRDFRGAEGGRRGALLERLHCRAPLCGAPADDTALRAGSGRRAAPGRDPPGLPGRDRPGAALSHSSCGRHARRQSSSSMSY